MADLLVRGVDETVVRALKQRAGERGTSAEAEHRAILTEALARPPKQIAAIALVNGVTVAARNMWDLAGAVDLHYPFT